MRFEEIFNAHKDKVFSLCYRYLQHEQEAEDAMQEVFVKVYLKKDSFREESKISTWIYRICVNHCLDLLKARRRKHQLLQLVSFLPFVPEVKDPSKGSGLEEKEAAQNLQEKMMRLPENQLTALVLNKLEGLSIEKVAQIMNTSYKAVESLLQRAKQNLQKQLNQSKD